MVLLLTLLQDAVPPAVRSLPDFSGAIGSSIDVTVAFSESQGQVGQSLQLTIVMLGMRNPDDVKRPNLTAIPSWANAFQCEDTKTRRENGRVEFDYLLIPRIAGEVSMPRLKIVYFNPAAAAGKQSQSTYAEVPRLSISPAWKDAKSNTYVIPERFLETRSSSWSPPMWCWLIPIPLSLALVKLFQSLQIQLSDWKRRRLLNQARERLKTIYDSPDPAAVVFAIVSPFSQNAESLRPITERIRFSPDQPQYEELVSKAERMLQP